MDILGLISIPAWLVLSLMVLLLLYIFQTWTHSTFKNMGVPCPRPSALFGTMLPAFTQYDDLWQFDRAMIEKYGSIFGLYEGRKPVLVVADPEAIKQICIKDFAAFTNRQQMIDRRVFISPFDKGMTVITDDHWKHVRSLLSPAFTSGKLKRMINQINKCADILLENLQEQAEKDGYVEVKEYSGCYTMDVIASTGFGIHIDSHKEADNPFVRHAKAIFKPKTLSIIVILIAPYLAVPLHKLGYNFLDKAACEFFVQVVNRAIDERRSQNLKQSDFLQLMIDAHVSLPSEEEMQDEEVMDSIRQSDFMKWSSKGLTDIEISAQATLFFLAGYETTAKTLGKLLYHLTVDEEVQDKVVAEVDEATGGAQITAEMLPKMTYLEQCIMETLRLHPPGPRTNREAGQNVRLGDILIPKGMRVDISIAGVHYDPEIYPEPEKFIPERFSPEARASRDPIHWLPFGVGPRNCIGLRLALLELKIAAARILQKLRLVKCDKTEVPVKLKMGSPVNPITIKVELR